MSFIDLISLIGFLLSVVSFATSSAEKLAPFKRELIAVGYVSFGFVISRILYTYLPPGIIAGVSLQPRSYIWVLLLVVMAIIVLYTLKKEGSRQAVWVFMLCFMVISTNGKSIGLIDNFKLRDNEILYDVEMNEKSGDLSRAIELLE